MGARLTKTNQILSAVGGVTGLAVIGVVLYFLWPKIAAKFGKKAVVQCSYDTVTLGDIADKRWTDNYRGFYTMDPNCGDTKTSYCGWGGSGKTGGDPAKYPTDVNGVIWGCPDIYGTSNRPNKDTPLLCHGNSRPGMGLKEHKAACDKYGGTMDGWTCDFGKTDKSKLSTWSCSGMKGGKATYNNKWTDGGFKFKK